MPLSVEYLTSLKESNIYIETGYDKGDGVQTALDCGFDRIISIEKYTINDRFEDQPKVIIYHGDSAIVLPQIIPNYPCFIFLDAHAYATTPIVQELEFLLTRKYDDLIVIDDRHCYEFKKPWGLDPKLFKSILAKFKSVKEHTTTPKLNDVFIVRK